MTLFRNWKMLVKIGIAGLLSVGMGLSLAAGPAGTEVSVALKNTTDKLYAGKSDTIPLRIEVTGARAAKLAASQWKTGGTDGSDFKVIHGTLANNDSVKTNGNPNGKVTIETRLVHLEGKSGNRNKSFKIWADSTGLDAGPKEGSVSVDSVDFEVWVDSAKITSASVKSGQSPLYQYKGGEFVVSVATEGAKIADINKLTNWVLGGNKTNFTIVKVPASIPADGKFELGLRVSGEVMAEDRVLKLANNWSENKIFMDSTLGATFTVPITMATLDEIKDVSSDPVYGNKGGEVTLEVRSTGLTLNDIRSSEGLILGAEAESKGVTIKTRPQTMTNGSFRVVLALGDGVAAGELGLKLAVNKVSTKLLADSVDFSIDVKEAKLLSVVRTDDKKIYGLTGGDVTISVASEGLTLKDVNTSTKIRIGGDDHADAAVKKAASSVVDGRFELVLNVPNTAEAGSKELKLAVVNAGGNIVADSVDFTIDVEMPKLTSVTGKSGLPVYGVKGGKVVVTVGSEGVVKGDVSTTDQLKLGGEDAAGITITKLPSSVTSGEFDVELTLDANVTPGKKELKMWVEKSSALFADTVFFDLEVSQANLVNIARAAGDEDIKARVGGEAAFVVDVEGVSTSDLGSVVLGGASVGGIQIKAQPTKIENNQFTIVLTVPSSVTVGTKNLTLAIQKSGAAFTATKAFTLEVIDGPAEFNSNFVEVKFDPPSVYWDGTSQKDLLESIYSVQYKSDGTLIQDSEYDYKWYRGTSSVETTDFTSVGDIVLKATKSSTSTEFLTTGSGTVQGTFKILPNLVSASPIGGITPPVTGAATEPASGGFEAGGVGYTASIAWVSGVTQGKFSANAEPVANVTLTLKTGYNWDLVGKTAAQRIEYLDGFLPEGAKSITSSSNSNTGTLVLAITFLKTAPAAGSKTLTWQITPKGGSVTATQIDLTLEARAISSEEGSTLTYTWYKPTSSAIPGTTSDAPVGTGPTYTVPNTLNGATTHYYYVVVSGTAGETAQKYGTSASNAVSVVVNKRTVDKDEFQVGGDDLTYNGSEQGVEAAALPSQVAGDTYTWTYKYERLAANGTTVVSTATVTNTTNSPEKVVEAGKYLVTVSVNSPKEAGSTAGRTILLTINPKELTDDMINVAEMSATQRIFDGTAKKPSVTVIDQDVPEKKRNLSYASSQTVGDYSAKVDKSANWLGVATSTNKDAIFSDNINAGENTAKITIYGFNNYTGSASAEFSIDKKVISIDAKESVIASKPYDGTDTLAASKVTTVAFKGLVGSHKLQQVTSPVAPVGGIVVKASLDGADVNAKRVANVEVTLGDDAVASNYRFENGETATFAKEGAWITKRAATKDDFAFDDFSKKVFYFTGNPQGIGVVNYKYAQPGDEGVTVLYTVNGKDTIAEPSAQGGPYEIKAQLTGSITNYTQKTGDKVSLGSILIGAPLKPTSVTISGNPGLTVRAGRSLVLTAKVNAAATLDTGALSFNWYKEGSGTGANKVDTLVSENGGKTYEPETDVVGSSKYYVWTLYTPDAEKQVPDSTKSSSVTVKIDEAAISLAGSALVTVGGTYTYNGNAQVPKASDIKVTYGTTALVNNTNYKIIDPIFNVDAGTGIVRVVGWDKYEDTATGTFTIQKKALAKADIVVGAVATYTGEPLPLEVKASGKMSNLGDVVVSYDGEGTVPVNAGKYAVKVTVKETGSSNFSVANGVDTTFDFGTYEIMKRTVTKADLDYNVNLLTPDSILVTKAPEDGIGPVKLKAADSDVTLTVLYNGKEAVPTTVGRHPVTVRVSGGKNFNATVVALGDYKLVSVIGVAEAARVIPTAPAATEAAVAPVKVAAAGFTAGPSPVQKNGVIKFFSAKQVKSGSLYIFDASGNAVAKVAAKPGTGEIASWNLKAKNGADVAEGTYVVKGALVGKDGTREKVSFVFSVVQ